MSENRVVWVDALKFLGMLAIYVGHFGKDAGNLYDFVFRYHVPLFFFMAGFFSTKGLHKPAGQFLYEKTRTILIPYFFFSVLLLFYYSTNGSWSLTQTIDAAVNYFYGVRNSPFVGSLWFINCIFAMFIIDYSVNKFVKNQFFVLLISIFAMFISMMALEHNPRQTPSMFWNIDSALSYWIYMVSGRLIYPKINHMFSSEKIKHKTIRTILLMSSSLIGVFFYYQGPNWLPLMTPSLFTTHTSYILYGLFGSYILIYLNCHISIYISRSKAVNNIGSSSLGLCGLENITKNTIPLVMGSLGLQFNIKSPIAALIFSFGCLLFSNYIYG